MQFLQNATRILFISFNTKQARSQKNVLKMSQISDYKAHFSHCEASGRCLFCVIVAESGLSFLLKEKSVFSWYFNQNLLEILLKI